MSSSSVAGAVLRPSARSRLQWEHGQASDRRGLATKSRESQRRGCLSNRRERPACLHCGRFNAPPITSARPQIDHQAARSYRGHPAGRRVSPLGICEPSSRCLSERHRRSVIPKEPAVVGHDCVQPPFDELKDGGAFAMHPCASGDQSLGNGGLANRESPTRAPERSQRVDSIRRVDRASGETSSSTNAPSPTTPHQRLRCKGRVIMPSKI